MTSPWREHVDELVREIEFREQHLLVMHKIDVEILNHASTLTETLSFILSELERALKAEHAEILFEHTEGLRIEISTDKDLIQQLVPMDRSISGLAFQSPAPILENNVPANSTLSELYYPRTPEGDARLPANLSVVVARITVDDHPIGVVHVESGAGQTFTAAHADFVAAIASQVSMAITHAALFDEDKLRNATDALLLTDSATDTDSVVRQSLNSILATLNSFGFINADAAEILFVDPQDPDLLVVAYSTNEADIGVRIGVSDSVSGQAFSQRETILLPRAYDDQNFKPLADGMKCEMAIPIQLGGTERFSIGVLNIESVRENAFSRLAQVIAERFARRVVNILALTKMRADVDSVIQDQFLLLAADQVLNAVHRINNHVGAARAEAQALHDDIEQGITSDLVEIQQRLSRVTGSADSALDIPEELRKRIGGPQQSVDVNDRVQAGIDLVRIPRNVRLHTDLAADLPNLLCTALDLVVENLMLNAIAAMAGPGGDVRVSTFLDSRTEGQTFVVVRVADSGVGMTKAQLETLFERREYSARVRGRGLGFGMPWVKAWIRRTYGLIDVDSQLGHGTSVTIRFQIDAQTGEPMMQQTGGNS